MRIYEIGAGNGTLMRDILQFIQRTDEEIYDTLEYTIIEISDELSKVQKDTISRMGISNGGPKVTILKQSIFEWTKEVPDDCFFIALEVLDNLAHDLIRYSMSGEVLQGFVLRNDDYSFEQAYRPATEKNLLELLSKRGDYKGTLGWRNRLNPIKANMTDVEFVATDMYALTNILKKFQKGKVILSDFHKLPNTVEGVGAPVVQTRQNGSTVAVSTYLVNPGQFDIFFPTDFKLLQDLIGGEVISHSKFMKENGDLTKSKMKNGENAMEMLYENVSFLIK